MEKALSDPEPTEENSRMTLFMDVCLLCSPGAQTGPVFQLGWFHCDWAQLKILLLTYKVQQIRRS